jgi:hypothetical protein
MPQIFNLILFLLCAQISVVKQRSLGWVGLEPYPCRQAVPPTHAQHGGMGSVTAAAPPHLSVSAWRRCRIFFTSSIPQVSALSPAYLMSSCAHSRVTTPCPHIQCHKMLSVGMSELNILLSSTIDQTSLLTRTVGY